MRGWKKRTLSLWRQGYLTMIGKITVIKTLTLSKLTYYLISLPELSDNLMEKIFKNIKISYGITRQN